MATSWPNIPPLPPLSPRLRLSSRSFWGKFWTGKGQSPGCGRLGSLPRAVWRYPSFRYLRVGGAQHPPLPNPLGLASSVCGALPSGGCVLQPLQMLTAPLLGPKPSAIFNWKLISSSLNRRPRQRQRSPPTHIVRPAHPTSDEMRPQPSCTVL